MKNALKISTDVLILLLLFSTISCFYIEPPGLRNPELRQIDLFDGVGGDKGDISAHQTMAKDS